MNEEFIIDNTMNLAGYKAVVAEHKASGQKMVILDSGKKPLLTQQDIKGQKESSALSHLMDTPSVRIKTRKEKEKRKCIN